MIWRIVIAVALAVAYLAWEAWRAPTVEDER